MSIHSIRHPRTTALDPKDPPKPHGPGVSLADLVGGAVNEAKKLAAQYQAAEAARQARERAQREKLVNGVKDTFEKIAYTRVAIDPHTQIDYQPGGVNAHANGDSVGIDFKLPKFSVKDLPNLIFTSPEK